MGNPSITQFLRSAAFRLILSYMLFFGASVAALLVFIYFATEREMNRQIRHSVNIQLADLGRKFILDGEADTVDIIRHLIQKDKRQTYVYLLIDPYWNVLAGNIEQWPGGSTTTKDWIVFSLPQADLEKPPTKVMAINTTLPGGYILLVGQKLTNKERLQQVILRVLQISMGLMVLLSLIGGGMTYLTIRKRLENVNAICQKVMAGELSHRVPVSGSGDEFDHLGENFNAMLSRIRELIDGIRDISNNVAHDLRTPLNHLRNQLEHLLEENLSPTEMRKQIKSAIGELDSVVATFNAILRISQAEAGAGIEQFGLVDISAVLVNVAELYEAWAEKKHIQLTQRIPPSITLQGDKHLLTQAFANLVDNAIKYTPKNGKVHITLREEKDKITASIADSGPGIPEEYYKRVTEKFFRLESSRTTPGSGLGLSLANAAFHLHGGQMRFSDEAPGLNIDVIFWKT